MSMQTDMALDAMMRALPDVAAIMNDKDADTIFAKYRGAGWLDQETGDAMMELVPLFVGKYRQNLYNIVAAFQGCTTEEIPEQDVNKTINALVQGLKTTTGFFTCCLHMARNM